MEVTKIKKLDIAEMYGQALDGEGKFPQKLSTITKELGKKEVKKSLFTFFVMLSKAIKAKEPMSNLEIKMLVDMVYSEYFWLTLDDLFDFSTKLFKSKLGPLYGKFDIPTIMEKLAMWDNSRNSATWGKSLESPKDETLLLAEPKKPTTPMPDELIQFANRLKIKNATAYQKPIEQEKLEPLERFRKHLIEKLGLDEDRAEQYIEIVLDQWYSEWEQIDSEGRQEWELFRDTTISELLLKSKRN